MWVGTGFAVVGGSGSVLLIRRRDVDSKAVAGIVVRSVVGIVLGLCAGGFLWLYVGHRVFGF
jgi:hypothetical protein